MIFFAQNICFYAKIEVLLKQTARFRCINGSGINESVVSISSTEHFCQPQNGYPYLRVMPADLIFSAVLPIVTESRKD
jgi:hypothetical protein